MKQFKISTSITNRDSSSVEKYFNEVSKELLLTAEEEVELAKRIKSGDQAALDRLVRANLRFVVSVAKQYQYSNMPLNDLINEGNIGLIRAAKSFDETRGFKFISYAVWWIRQSIMLALSQNSRTVRIPYNKSGELSKIHQASAVIEQKFEREPTHEELAEFLGIEVENIKNAESAHLKQLSLDASFDEDDGGSLLDIIANPDSVSADRRLENDSLSIEVDRLLRDLSVREREIVARSYGIGFEYSYSLEDIAESLGLTRERVRQIKEGALRKLRSASSFRLLKPYIS